MNLKPGYQDFAFEAGESEQSKSSPFQSFRGDKSRVSYGGGFHIAKKISPTPPSRQNIASDPIEIANRMSSANGYSSIEVLENEIQRLKFQSQGMENLRKSKYSEGILHLDPPSHRHPSHYEEKNIYEPHIGLQELELLKEKNATRLLEIEAELLRSKQEENHGKRKFSGEYVPVFKQKKIKEKKSVNEYERKYQEKFEKYVEDKEKKRQIGLIKGKELRISQGADDEHEEAVENEVLLKWMFKKLDKDQSGTVDKIELIQEFHNNPELAKLFGFFEQVSSPRYLERFNQIFEKIGVGQKHEISISEFLLFFEKFSKSSKKFEKKPETLPKSPKKNLRKSASAAKAIPPSESFPICLLAHKHMLKIEEVYNALDVHQDFVIKRGVLIESLMEDPGIIKILHIDAVKISHFQVLDLESMLIYILNDGDGEEEFITWNQFIDYFFVTPLFEEGKFEGIENPKLDEIDLPDKYVNFLLEIFSSLPAKGPNKVSTFEFVQAVRKDSKTSGILGFIARTPMNLSAFAEETLGETLKRIEETAESLIAWGDILSYLSKRGVPKDLLFGESLVTRNSFVKPKFPQRPIHEYAVQTDDVEFKKSSSRSISISPRGKVTFRDTKSFEKGLTVPEPFHFEKREQGKKKSIREKWVEKVVKEKNDEEARHLNFKYKAQEIPREVLMPKYESLRKALEERSLNVKRTSMERTKQLERPFSFYIREKEKVKKEPIPSPEYTFKANPIPWACTVPLYDYKLKEEEALREERKSRAAQQDLRKASLPPRMEMYQSLKKNQPEVTRTPSPKFHVKEPPNFEKLHDRFAKTLEAKKKAKQTTKIEPFLIDQRVEVAEKKKEEKKKLKEEKRMKEEEEKKKVEMIANEERRLARVKAKENWKFEHASLKNNNRSRANEKRSPGRITADVLKPDKFTEKDLRPEVFTINDLKSGTKKKKSLSPAQKKEAANRRSSQKKDEKPSLAPKKVEKKPTLAPNKDEKPSLAAKKDEKPTLGPNKSEKPSLAPQRDEKPSLAPSNPLASGANPFPAPLSSNILAPASQFPDFKAKPTSSSILGPGIPGLPKPEESKLSLSPVPPNPLAPSHEKVKHVKTKEEKELEKQNKKNKKMQKTKKEDSEFTFKDLEKEPEPAKKAEISTKNLKYNTIKPKLKSAINSDEQHALLEKIATTEKLHKRKEDARREEREYQQKLKEMKEKVSQRPLLVESATDASSKNRAKMKILLQIKKSLVESGLKTETYFTEEEQDLIQEAEYLTKMHRFK